MRGASLGAKITLKNRCSLFGSAIYGLLGLSLLFCGAHRACRFGADALFVVSIPSSLLVLPTELLIGWLPTRVVEPILSVVLLAAPFLNGWLVGRCVGWFWEELKERSAMNSIRRA
jgi:hypothetical protein